jgi:hypothetical protein
MRVAAKATMPPISTTTRMISMRLKPDCAWRGAGARKEALKERGAVMGSYPMAFVRS